MSPSLIFLDKIKSGSQLLMRNERMRKSNGSSLLPSCLLRTLGPRGLQSPGGSEGENAALG